MVGGLRTSDNLIWTSDEPNRSMPATCLLPHQCLGPSTLERGGGGRGTNTLKTPQYAKLSRMSVKPRQEGGRERAGRDNNKKVLAASTVSSGTSLVCV